MKAYIYRTSKLFGTKDKATEKILKDNSIPYTKENIKANGCWYNDSVLAYVVTINNLEELIGLHRIFEEKLIIEETSKGELLIEVYDDYRE